MDKQLIKIQSIFEMFILKKIGIEELQSRLETAIIPENFEDTIKELINIIEEVRFTILEENQYLHVYDIINDVQVKHINKPTF
ncbi:hypothetical protein PaeBR_08410 [Paenibacillus sp. BR2-3]|uniref:hypothetical protein n=1 Tax=Paenibacillus sp. BR2-3 TaxID=3048494 RepID=UPI00397725F7